jgi:tetratricopeptide (TPR) repeat protein
LTLFPGPVYLPPLYRTFPFSAYHSVLHLSIRGSPVTGSVEEEILELRARHRSDRDPSGRGFAPLADALRRAGRLDEAAAVVDEGLSALPDFSAGHMVAAWIRRDRGDAEGAQAALREVLRRDPLNVLALRHLARFRSEAGDAEEAGQLMERAAGVDGGAGEQVDAEVLVTRAPAPSSSAEAPGGHPGTGATDEESTGPEGAGSQATEAALPVPDLPDANPDWFAESWSEGEAEAEEPPFPGEGVHTRTMAELYASQGLLDRAVEVYQGLLELDPGNDELTDRLAALVEQRRLRRAQGHEAAGPGVESPAEGGPGAALPAGNEEVAPFSDLDTDESAATLHLPTGGDVVESPFSWTSPTSGEPAEAEGSDVPVAGFFDELLSWAPPEAGGEVEDETESRSAAIEASGGMEEPVALEAVEGLEAVERVEVELLGAEPDTMESGEVAAEPVPVGPPGSPDNPVAVEELAPDGEIPAWVPVEALAPDGPLPSWVPIGELAPDPAEERDPSAALGSPPPPDATDDEFRAWLERLRL